MSEANVENKYPVAMRILHWLMALTILGLIATGYYMADLPDDAPNKYDLYPWHKSFGVSVIFLVVIRIGVRLKSTIPQLPTTLKEWEIKASHSAHMALYILMAAVPLSGYAMSGSYEMSKGINFFGLMLPNIVPKDQALFDAAHLVHENLPYLLLGVILIHVAGATKHRFFDEEGSDVLRRML